MSEVCKHGVGVDDLCHECNECNEAKPKKLADLRAEAEALRDATMKACGEGLEAVLKKHGCKLVGAPRIENGQIVADVVLSVE